MAFLLKPALLRGLVSDGVGVFGSARISPLSRVLARFDTEPDSVRSRPWVDGFLPAFADPSLRPILPRISPLPDRGVPKTRTEVDQDYFTQSSLEISIPKETVKLYQILCHNKAWLEPSTWKALKLTRAQLMELRRPYLFALNVQYGLDLSSCSMIANIADAHIDDEDTAMEAPYPEEPEYLRRTYPIA